MSTPNTHFGHKKIGEFLNNCPSVFFIGIGGINMSSLALICKKRGYKVGGSDRSKTKITEKLQESGIDVFYSHSEENIKGYSAAVYTVAIPDSNPEYKEAQKMGIPLISRADFLGYIMTDFKNRVGISGMHGKSSCTSMCAQTFIKAGMSPTVISGAELEIMDGAYTLGSGDSFIFEACEYMDSFLDFNPTVAVVLNVDMDHVDYFHSMDQICSSFNKFMKITENSGCAVINGDDENTLKASKGYKGKLYTFGIDSKNLDYKAENIENKSGFYSFDVYKNGKYFCRTELSVTGSYNIYNALACVASCDICGISAEKIESGLKSYKGAVRRMEFKGSLCGADVFDDYGHHPKEVYSTLYGAKQRCGENKLFCVFQPHTYSRTKALLEDFAKAFEYADRVILADIYAAREIDDGSVSSKILADKIGEKAVYGGDFESCAKILKAEVGENDTVTVMGAGDIYKIFPLLDLKKEK